MTDIQIALKEISDEKYKKFTAGLIPNVSSDTIMGVRTPALRDFAKGLNRDTAEVFLKELPHRFYEENNLHAFLIEKITDFEECIKEIDRFLPFIDNWATCDSMRPKIFKKYSDRLLTHIKRWIASDNTYTVRFGLEMLMCYFLDENFDPEYLSLAAHIRSDEYYVNMMIAWFFATALAKQYDATLPYIEKGLLQRWTHNKAIQKSIESFRITREQKDYLKTLKRKE